MPGTPRTEPQYNTHQNQFEAKVFYPFHPRAGEHIYVVGTRIHRSERCYVIARENGKTELIPEWMTKSDAQNMSIVSTPLV